MANNASTELDGAGISRSVFDRELTNASKAFVEWRYVHEKQTANANLDFLRKLGEAIQKALLAA